MRILLQDVRYALRQLKRAPGFTFICVLTLALGIGANTAIFTLVDAVMLKSLPVKNPKELYSLGKSNKEGNYEWSTYPPKLYQNIREGTPEFRDMAAFQDAPVSLGVRRSGSSGSAEAYGGQIVSGSYFSTFGIAAFAGRTLSPADDRANAPPVVMMSYHTWQQHYALDPSVVGSTFIVNQVPFTVIGIAGPGFFGDRLQGDPPDFWLPIATYPLLKESIPLDQWLSVIGRLKPNAQIGAVQSKLNVELQQWLASHPEAVERRADTARVHITLTPAAKGGGSLEFEYHDGIRLVMMLAAVILLIASSNIATLMLARGAAMRTLTAVRVALGAPRRRLIRQVLTESVLLAILGGLGGLFFAFAGTRVILLLIFRGAHYIPIDPSPSFTVLAFTFGISVLTGILFGVLPAWANSDAEPARALRGIGISPEHRSFTQKALVVVQIALSLGLLMGAGLLTKSLWNLENQRFGFESKNRLLMTIDPKVAGYQPAKLYGLYQQLQQRLPQIPRVVSASYSTYSPLSRMAMGGPIAIEGQPASGPKVAAFDRVGPRYFETIGTPLLRGRTINEEDTPTAQKVAVINETFARRFLPQEDAIGKHFGFAHPGHDGDFEIVGIVGDAKYTDPRAAAVPVFFLPFLQATTEQFDTFTHYAQVIELQVRGNPESSVSAVRRILADIDPNLSLNNVTSMQEHIDLNFNQETLIARLTELFGLLALALACVGLYGVTAYSVARRTSEIGIRMALGANRGNVLKLVLRGALVQLCIGLAIGIPAALASGRLLANQLYGVKTYDPAILSLTVLLLGAGALLAGLIPARRAATVDPVDAMRAE